MLTSVVAGLTIEPLPELAYLKRAPRLLMVDYTRWCRIELKLEILGSTGSVRILPLTMVPCRFF